MNTLKTGKRAAARKAVVALAALALVAVELVAFTPDAARASGESPPQTVPDCGVAITATDAVTGTEVAAGQTPFATVDSKLAAFLHATVHNDGTSESLVAPGCTMTIDTQGTILDVSPACSKTDSNTATCIFNSVPGRSSAATVDLVIQPPANASSFTTTASAVTHDPILEAEDMVADTVIADPDESQTITVMVSGSSGFGLLCDRCTISQTTENGIVHSITGGNTGGGYQLVKLSEYVSRPGDCGTNVCAPFGSNIEWGRRFGGTQDAPVEDPNLLTLTTGKNTCNGLGGGCLGLWDIPSVAGATAGVEPACAVARVASPDPCTYSVVAKKSGSRTFYSAAAKDLIRIPIAQSG